MAARLARIREFEDEFCEAPPEAQRQLHVELAFYMFLSDTERKALASRLEDELRGESSVFDADSGTRLRCDKKSRDMLIEMLEFEEAARLAGFDVVDTVGAAEHAAVMAITASGSLLELDCPRRDGARPFVYLSKQQRYEGLAELDGDLEVGRPARFGESRTSNLLVIARGSELPRDADADREATAPDSRPAATDEDEAMIAEGYARLKAAIQGAESAKGEGLRRAMYESAASWAGLLQSAMGRGHDLSELAWFESRSGSRYEVRRQGALGLVRRASGADAPTIWMSNADIRDQRVVEGAPLVIFYEDADGMLRVACVFRVGALRPR